MVKVLSLGGSIVAPKSPDAGFLKDYSAEIRRYLDEFPAAKLIMVVGGGGPARDWQNAAREATRPASGTGGSASVAVNDDALDWIGIMATRLNARLVKTVFHDLCPQDVVTDPTAVDIFLGRVMVAAGWKPGFSTDFDAVLLAERFQADTVVNLSNIAKVYTADPKLDPSAKPVDEISWEDFRAIVGDTWTPGKNLPFDPVATRKAAELGLKVVCAAGANLENLSKILRDQPFEGTLIRP